MSQKKIPTFVKTTANAALSSLLALGLSSCGQSHYVKCYGVAKTGNRHWIGMTKGECEKLASSHAQPITATEMQHVKKYTAEDYIKCYGVAAGSKNDCGTKTTACGGSVQTPKAKDAWIAIPKGLCQQIKGGIVVTPKKS